MPIFCVSVYVEQLANILGEARLRNQFGSLTVVFCVHTYTAKLPQTHLSTQLTHNGLSKKHD